MEVKYELTVETLGPDKDQVKEVRVLNRVLGWTSKGIEYEADPRHVEIILQQLNIDKCKPVTTPGTKEEGELKSGDAILAPRLLLDEQRSYAYRALVARANYLAPDRPDIAFAVKELARAMSKPDEGDRCRLKRLAGYPKGKPRLVKMFKWQEWPTHIFNLHRCGLGWRQGKQEVDVGRVRDDGEAPHQRMGKDANPHCTQQRRIRALRRAESCIRRPGDAVDCKGPRDRPSG